MDNYYRVMTLHERCLFRVMPKGYGRSSKDVREFIDELYRMLDSDDEYVRKLNERVCELYNRLNKVIEYIDEMCKFGNKYVCHGDDLNPEYIIKVLRGRE